MLGVYSESCIWQKKGETNKYGEYELSTPETLKCCKSTDKIRVRDKEEEKIVVKNVYLLQNTNVEVGDTLDGFTVSEIIKGTDTTGKLLVYKAVVNNA